MTEKPLTPGWKTLPVIPSWHYARLGTEVTHEHLSAIVISRPGDYYAYRDRDDLDGAGTFGLDCAAGCKWYAALDGELGYDWGVCCNPRSQRCGLLTFEHQGCEHFEESESDSAAEE